MLHVAVGSRPSPVRTRPRSACREPEREPENVAAHLAEGPSRCDQVGRASPRRASAAPTACRVRTSSRSTRSLTCRGWEVPSRLTPDSMLGQAPSNRARKEHVVRHGAEILSSDLERMPWEAQEGEPLSGVGICLSGGACALRPSASGSSKRSSRQRGCSSVLRLPDTSPSSPVAHIWEPHSRSTPRLPHRERPRFPLPLPPGLRKRRISFSTVVPWWKTGEPHSPRGSA